MIVSAAHLSGSVVYTQHPSPTHEVPVLVPLFGPCQLGEEAVDSGSMLDKLQEPDTSRLHHFGVERLFGEVKRRSHKMAAAFLNEGSCVLLF